jgi:hypothetical protein
VEQDQPPHQSRHLLNQVPQFGLIPKPPPKRRRVNKCGTYISTTQAHDHPTMSIDSDMNVSGIPSTPASTMVSGVPSTPSSSVVWIPETPSLNATQPMVSAQSMGMNPFVFLSGTPNHSTQSMPWASNPFSFGMPDMTSHLSSSILTSNVNPSFGSGGTTPPYTPFSFGGGHIPQPTPTVGGWNPPSSRPNPSYNFKGGVHKWVVLLLLISHPSILLPQCQFLRTLFLWKTFL